MKKGKGWVAVIIYLLLASLIAWWMYRKDFGEQPNQVKDADAMTWSEIKDNVTVPGKPTGIWTPVLDYVKGPALIKIEASGEWSYTTGKSCGPDGDLNALIGADRTIATTAPLGALIAKVGGSTAGVSDGAVRVAGSMALIQIDEKTSGPIFLTINDELSGFKDNSGQLTVKISVAQLAPPAARETPTAINESDEEGKS